MVDPDASPSPGTTAQGLSPEPPPGAADAPAITSPGERTQKGTFAFFRRLFGGARPTRIAAAFGGAAAFLGAIVGVFAATHDAAPATSPRTTLAPVAASASGIDPVFTEAGTNAAPDAVAPPNPPKAATWRISELSGDPGVRLVSQTIERRPLLVALAAAGLPRPEAQRVTRSLSDVRNVDRFGPKDTLTLARDKATGRVVAYELVSTPADVWQAREEPAADGAPKLVTRKLDLSSAPVRVQKAVLVGADLRASLAEAGLAPVEEVMALLDTALEGHADLLDIRPGARIRLVGTQEQVDGAPSRWLSLDAVEYFPAADGAPAVRVYQFADDEASKKHRGFYDAKGRQPVHGGWRMPVPLARIASRFNPQRMHPVLHVIMPHNGVDFAAPIGAPVYATAAGVVTSVGFDGPCGNKVEISHPQGMTSVYCHLSRFAADLRVGQRVEQRQLIAYVGKTGRVTGPHLHFGMRRGGAFIDPLTLRLDGMRVVPRARRDEFDRMRAELDAELDSIPLPAANPAPPTTGPEPETIYEEPP